ncbi:MAG: hypothetical protein IKL40_05510 [Clostridia bacterium]|nr:hypothetical protein [Clostridia bacterium]
MGKSKKLKRQFRQQEEQEKKFNWRLLWMLVLCFAVVFGIYQLMLKLAVWLNEPVIQEITLSVYSGALTVLLVIFIIMNKGISKDIPTKEVLPDEWDDEKKESFIESYVTGKQKARKLLLIIIPLIVTILIDMIYLFYFN